MLHSKPRTLWEPKLELCSWNLRPPCSEDNQQMNFNAALSGSVLSWAPQLGCSGYRRILPPRWPSVFRYSCALPETFQTFVVHSLADERTVNDVDCFKRFSSTLWVRFLSFGQSEFPIGQALVLVCVLHTFSLVQLPLPCDCVIVWSCFWALLEVWGTGCCCPTDNHTCSLWICWSFMWRNAACSIPLRTISEEKARGKIGNIPLCKSAAVRSELWKSAVAVPSPLTELIALLMGLMRLLISTVTRDCCFLCFMHRGSCGCHSWLRSASIGQFSFGCCIYVYCNYAVCCTRKDLSDEYSVQAFWKRSLPYIYWVKESKDNIWVHVKCKDQYRQDCYGCMWGGMIEWVEDALKVEEESDNK